MRFLSANFQVQATALGTVLALAGSNQNTLQDDTAQNGARPSFAKAAHMSGRLYTRSNRTPAFGQRFQSNGTASGINQGITGW